MSATNRDNNIREREKIAKEIEKTSESIRRKHYALKTGQMEESIALEKHFKPITEPLRKIVNNSLTLNDESESATGIEPLSFQKCEVVKDENMSGCKRKQTSLTHSLAPQKPKRRTFNASMTPVMTPIMTSTPTKTSENIQLPITDDVYEYEATRDSLAASVRNQLQTYEGQETLRKFLGPLSQKYIGDVLSGNQDSDIVYGVYFDKDEMMLGNKRFDVDNTDNILIDGVRYIGTHGIYELIFKKRPNRTVYTEDDLQKYKSILMITSAHKRDHIAQNPIQGNRGYKYKTIIAPLLSNKVKQRTGRGLFMPCNMFLNNNKIDYVHWDDPNELVDRLRLLEASRQAGNNAHDNEILSIIEELREAGLIIN